VAKQGRTVIFVSHNLALIQALCHRGVLLERGRAIAGGPVAEVLDSYLRTLERAADEDLLARTDRDSRGYDETLVTRVEVLGSGAGHTELVVGGRPVTIVVHVTAVLPAMECQITICNSLGHPVTTLDSEVSSLEDLRDPALGPRIECEVDPLSLLPGRYRIDVLLKGRHQIQDGLQAAAFFDVEPGVVAGRPMPGTSVEGDVALPHVWRLPA
jgi:lipopolysaccharide transport system ATP-binding protein